MERLRTLPLCPIEQQRLDETEQRIRQAQATRDRTLQQLHACDAAHTPSAGVDARAWREERRKREHTALAASAVLRATRAEQQRVVDDLLRQHGFKINVAPPLADEGEEGRASKRTRTDHA